MNSLNITNEKRQITFDYTSNLFKFQGVCCVSSDNTITDINVQVMLLEDTNLSIGNCNSNNGSSINIWDSRYSHYIDSIATDFKALQTELVNTYNV